MVRIAAFQAVGPGSIPGCRIFNFLIGEPTSPILAFDSLRGG